MPVAVYGFALFVRVCMAFTSLQILFLLAVGVPLLLLGLVMGSIIFLCGK